MKKAWREGEREREQSVTWPGGKAVVRTERDKRRESGRRQKAKSRAGPGSRDVTHEGKGKGERGNPNC